MEGTLGPRRASAPDTESDQLIAGSVGHRHGNATPRYTTERRGSLPLTACTTGGAAQQDKPGAASGKCLPSYWVEVPTFLYLLAYRACLPLKEQLVFAIVAASLSPAGPHRRGFPGDDSVQSCLAGGNLSSSVGEAGGGVISPSSFPFSPVLPGVITLPEDQASVSALASEWLSYMNLVRNIPGLLSTLLVCSLTHTRGRRMGLVLPCAGAILKNVVFLCALYFRSPLSLFLVGELLEGLGGSLMTFQNVAYAYLADIIVSGDKAFRFSVLQALYFLATALGNVISGVCIASIGFEVTLWGYTALLFFNILYIAVFLAESNTPTSVGCANVDQAMKQAITSFKVFCPGGSSRGGGGERGGREAADSPPRPVLTPDINLTPPTPPALTPPALTPSALTPSALTPSALTPSALTPSALTPLSRRKSIADCVHPTVIVQPTWGSRDRIDTASDPGQDGLATASYQILTQEGVAATPVEAEGAPPAVGRCATFLLALMLIAYICDNLILQGRNDIDVLFMVTLPFCWSPTTIGFFQAAKYLCKAVSGTILIRLFQYCIPDPWIGVMAATSGVAGNVLMGLAWNSLMLWNVTWLGMLSGLVAPLAAALMSRLVAAEDQSALFASLGVVEGICDLVSSTSLDLLYAQTAAIFPGTSFLVISALYLLAGGCFLVTICIGTRHLE